MNIEKCRYSIDGKCMNENVACDVCHSTDVEMRSCTPLQRCVLLYDDNWIIKTEENIDDMKENNGSFKAFDGGNPFVQPENRFLLIYESREDGISIAWTDNEEDLLEVIKEVKGYGCKIIDAIEIESCREINTEEI